MEIEEMKERIAKMQEEANQRVAKMTPEERKHLKETSRRFARKCEMPEDSIISIKK